MDQITAIVSLTADEYSVGQRAYQKATNPRASLYLLGYFGLIGLLLVLTGAVVAGGAVLFVGVLFGSGVLQRSTLRRLYRRDPQNAEQLVFQFGPLGYGMTGVGIETRVAWARVKRIIDSDSVLVFDLGRRAIVTMPKRTLPPQGPQQIVAWSASAGGPLRPIAA